MSIYHTLTLLGGSMRVGVTIIGKIKPLTSSIRTLPSSLNSNMRFIMPLSKIHIRVSRIVGNLRPISSLKLNFCPSYWIYFCWSKLNIEVSS